jgi:plasmid stabilization system protein ParE
MPVGFHRLATREFVAARRWYGVRSPAAEARFVAEMADAVARIDAMPAAGCPSSGPYRWVKLKKFPYLLHYEEVGPGRVTVYAVAHGSRRPGYWRRRRRRP